MHTEGITKISLEDVDYADVWGGVIKLIGSVKMLENGQVHIMVCPMLVHRGSQLASVDDVFNGIMVRGDSTGDVVFYGKGAGKLPTASAVVADVIDCIKHFEARKYLFWEDSSNEDVISPEDSVTAMYIRVQTDDEDKAMDEAERLFGKVKRIYRSGEPNNELSFTIGEMRFGDIMEKLSQFESDGIKILSKIRIADF